MAMQRSVARGIRVAAILVSAGAVLSGPVAMVIVSSVAPQPSWTDIGTFANHYQPIQGLPYVVGYVLLTGFVLFAAACHAGAVGEFRVRTSASLIFTAVYAALVFTNYTIQLGFIPRVLGDRPAFLGQLTMANPAAFAWFLEMFGYAALGAATWLVAPGFRGSGRADLIRSLLVANGGVSVVGAVCTALFDRWVFSGAGMVSFLAWNALIPLCFGLIAISPEVDFAGGRPPSNDGAAEPAANDTRGWRRQRQ